MGAYVEKEAIGNNQKPNLIINASGVPKQIIPDTSAFYQKEMGYKGIPSFSIHCTCLSFVVALNIASEMIHNKSMKCILIISSDRGTRGRNFEEPESATILGDGAATVMLEHSDGTSKLHNWKMKTWPSGTNLTEVRGGGTNKHPDDESTTKADNLFTMDGPAIYKMAIPRLYKLMLSTFNERNFNQKDIDWVVPHQALLKAVNAYNIYGGFLPKEKIINILPYTGNCIAASIPMAFVTAVNEGKIKRGDLIFFIGTGAGLSAATAIMTY